MRRPPNQSLILTHRKLLVMKKGISFKSFLRPMKLDIDWKDTVAIKKGKVSKDRPGALLIPPTRLDIASTTLLAGCITVEARDGSVNFVSETWERDNVIAELSEFLADAGGGVAMEESVDGIRNMTIVSKSHKGVSPPLRLCYVIKNTVASFLLSYEKCFYLLVTNEGITVIGPG